MRDVAVSAMVSAARLTRGMDEHECRRRNALSRTIPGFTLRSGDVGTVLETLGNNEAFLVEFNSALEAAQCAVEIQRTLAKRDADAPAERQIQLRIGIHIGDVVHRAGDVYGDGVNIASRIEPLANAGGICVSMDVERQIRNAVETRFEKLAPTELKNISVPMELFRIVLPWEIPGTSVAQTKALAKSTSSKWPPALFAIVLLLIIGAGWWWTTQLRRHAALPAVPSEPAVSDKSIAVLPFVNMSSDKDQEFFSDGISEELLNLLAKVPQLQVAARTSSLRRASAGSASMPGCVRRVGSRAIARS